MRVHLGVVLASLLMATACGGTETAGPTEGIRVGGTPSGWHTVAAKHVTLPSGKTLNAKARSVPNSHAKPVLVNFWASWCGPCLEELPVLAKMANSGRVTVVGVTRDVSITAAQKTLSRTGARYPNWQDPSGTYLHTWRGILPINSFPSSALVVDGQVRAVHIGSIHHVDELDHLVSRFEHTG